MVSFADITTIGVGGPIARFIEPTTRVGFIEAIEEADDRGLPLFVIGGGSNLLASDAPFDGIVVRDARREINVLDEAAPVEAGGEPIVHVNAEAGVNWDDFVEFAVRIGLEGVEGLSGIPGTVGASVVQNIGAYGQEVASTVESVEAWDRRDKVVRELGVNELEFGYRTSLLKRSMQETGTPTPRYIVLSVTFALRHSATGVVNFGQLASALGVEVGARMDTTAIREAVLRVRAAKGMLEDPTRYGRRTVMAGTKRAENVEADVARLEKVTAETADNVGPAVVSCDSLLADRHSCGSFFTNPILPADAPALDALPSDAPRFEATDANGRPGIKLSAAWLIDHAGFHKGYRLADDAPAGLSTKHTLALTNRGGASAADVMALADAIVDGVEKRFGVRLVPEPVIIGAHSHKN